MASSSNNTERDSELLFIGQQCTHKSCYQVDFLPFKCNHCSKAYCGEHYLPLQHSCSQYDVSKHDRVAPPCPMCQTPIAIPPNEDPNIRMGQHLDVCPVITGRKTTSSTPRCSNQRCKKVIYAPIKCDTCRQQFCAEHRFPSTHKCLDTQPAAAAPSKTATGPSSNPLEKAKATVTKAMDNASPQAAAGLSAMKRAMETKIAAASKPKAPTTSTSSSGGTSSNGPSKTHNPFNKTDRRAKAEEESRKKALRERAKKGLLTEQEKKILAEAEAKGSGDDKDKCVIM